MLSEGHRPVGIIIQPEGSKMWPVGAYFSFPGGRGGILTSFHGRADHFHDAAHLGL